MENRKTSILTMEALIKIQSELKAPKNQFNTFGKYKYRNCEDILEALKPLLTKYDCILTLSDEIKESNGIMYVQATAQIICGETVMQVQAQAGIDPNRKGMDISQSFGSSSSYARKHALNGLFLIDDTKDADSTNDHSDKKSEPKSNLPALTVSALKAMLEAIEGGNGSKVLERMTSYTITTEQMNVLTAKLKANGL